MKLNSWVYLSNGFDVSHTVHATDFEHAKVKLMALHGITPKYDAWLMPHTDNVAMENLVYESMHNGLTRSEMRLATRTPKSAYGI